MTNGQGEGRRERRAKRREIRNVLDSPRFSLPLRYFLSSLFTHIPQSNLTHPRLKSGNTHYQWGIRGSDKVRGHWVAIDRLDNQIFGFSKSAPWKIKFACSCLRGFHGISSLLTHGIYHCMCIWPINPILTPLKSGNYSCSRTNPGIRGTCAYMPVHFCCRYLYEYRTVPVLEYSYWVRKRKE